MYSRMRLCDLPMRFVCADTKVEFKSAADVHFQVKGYTDRYDTVREELWHQPMYYGFLGPMWDDGVLRYETQEVYNELSR